MMLRRAAAFLLLLIVSSAAQAEWREVTSPHFVVYGDTDEKYLRSYAAKLERYDAALRLILRIPAEAESNPLTVLVAASTEGVQRVYGKKGTGVAGFYRPHAAGSYAVVPRPRVRDEFLFGPETVIYHEYAHHLMLQYFPAAYPPWFTEGFAEFVATLELDQAGRATIGKPAGYRAAEIYFAEHLPIERLLAFGMTKEKKDEGIDSFYGRSWLLTHFLFMSPQRKPQLDQYLRALNEGKDPITAAAVFGNLPQLTKELSLYFRKNVYPTLTYPLPALPDAAITSRVLRPGEARLAEERLQYFSGVPEKKVQAFAQKVEAAATAYPKDPYVLELLAGARFSAKNYKGTIAACDDLLAVAPSNSRGMLWKGKALVEIAASANPADADWKSARAWLVKANRADGNDPLPYIAYFESFGRAAQPAPKIAIEGLERALELAPQERNLRLELAFAYGSEGRFDRASTVIRPLAYSPHRGEKVELARTYLSAFEQSKMPDPDAISGSQKEEDDEDKSH